MPSEIIIETDLSLRRKEKELVSKEQNLLKTGVDSIELYDNIFTELELELDNAEQQILSYLHQTPELVQDGIHILQDKNLDMLNNDFQEKCIKKMLRTDVVIRSSFI